MKLILGDCLTEMAKLPPNSVDSIVTDPPYELGFMNKKWDASGISYQTKTWREALRLLKPGGHLLAFGGTRTYHRLACAIEDAGFEIRDSIHWIYGSGFPKSLDVSKAIDKAAGAEREIVGSKRLTGNALIPTREKGGTYVVGAGVAPPGEIDITAPSTDLAKKWDGWGTALKPAHEPIVVARKPLIGTVAKNIEKWGTGGINVDGCRVGYTANDDPRVGKGYIHNAKAGLEIGKCKDNASGNRQLLHSRQGRWPPNVALSPEAAEEMDLQKGGHSTTGKRSKKSKDNKVEGNQWLMIDDHNSTEYTDRGGASRFFPIFKYQAKANKKERNAGLTERNTHPTVKPLELMRWLVRLVTPPNGTVLDPFMGSGTTGIAAALEGLNFIGIEIEKDSFDIAEQRIAHHTGKED